MGCDDPSTAPVKPGSDYVTATPCNPTFRCAFAFGEGTQVRKIIEDLGMRYTTPSSLGPDGVLTTADVHGNEVIAKARGHVGE